MVGEQEGTRAPCSTFLQGPVLWTYYEHMFQL